MSENTSVPQHDWVIDGLLERRERLIITGFEGIGKSSLLRQIAVFSAAGIHPFTGQPMAQRRVLFVDCENDERRVARALLPLQHTADTQGRPSLDLIHTAFRPLGLDLGGDDRRWLTNIAVDLMPDLLVIGPLYRMGPADLNDESAAQTIMRALDEVRVKTDCAVIVEAHAERAAHDGQRSVRPAGSSLFLRWPDYGVGLRPSGDRGAAVTLTHWRGPREERPWPLTLKRNTDNDGWPWLASFRSSSADTEEN